MKDWLLASLVKDRDDCNDCVPSCLPSYHHEWFYDDEAFSDVSLQPFQNIYMLSRRPIHEID